MCIRDSLQRARGVAADRSEHRRGLDAAHALRVGDSHALDVLDDVARAADLHVLGLAPEHAPRERGGVCDGDGLGAAQRADQLMLEQIAQLLIGHSWGRSVLGHDEPPGLSLRYSKAHCRQ